MELIGGGYAATTRTTSSSATASPSSLNRDAGYGSHGLTEGDVPADGKTITSPGPTLVLHRNEPVEIIVVNRLPEATAIHWHGMELDSYYDGVHGWSGTEQRLAPMIEPGESFTVRFTPRCLHVHCCASITVLPVK